MRLTESNPVRRAVAPRTFRLHDHVPIRFRV